MMDDNWMINDSLKYLVIFHCKIIPFLNLFASILHEEFIYCEIGGLGADF